MRKKYILVLLIGILFLTGCSMETRVQEQKDYYLVVTKEKYKDTASIPEGKCSIILQGRHSMANLEETANANEEFMVKNNLEQVEDKKYFGCIDDFTKEQVTAMVQDDSVFYIRFVGNKDPLGAY